MTADLSSRLDDFARRLEALERELAELRQRAFLEPAVPPAPVVPPPPLEPVATEARIPPPPQKLAAQPLPKPPAPEPRRGLPSGP